VNICSTVKTREQWMIRLYENVDKKKKKRREKFSFLELKRKRER
jgi:hypothetical protein